MKLLLVLLLLCRLTHAEGKPEFVNLLPALSAHNTQFDTHSTYASDFVEVVQKINGGYMFLIVVPGYTVSEPGFLVTKANLQPSTKYCISMKYKNNFEYDNLQGFRKVIPVFVVDTKHVHPCEFRTTPVLK